MPGPVSSIVRRYAQRLRYPRLLLLTAAIFGIDLVVPDMIPFVDEILFGLGTVLLASLPRRRPAPTAEQEGREPAVPSPSDPPDQINPPGT